ncbi:MAG: ATP-dependent DNA helicase RecG [Campylobacter sp.]|nr:ATP-dependent DNA helicase RecG [Campylobacter sp.]
MSEELAKLRSKLGVKTAIDLALLIPKSYEDLSLSQTPNFGENTVEIETKFFNTRGKVLTITAYCISWQQDIKLTIFNAKPWHYSTFKSGKKIYIHGKSDIYRDMWQFTNPKVITKVGEILPKYKLEIRDMSIKKIIDKYLNKDSLLAEGLNESEAKLLLEIHRGDKNSVRLLKNLEEDTKMMKTLKFIEIYNYMRRLSSKKFTFKAKPIKIYPLDEWLKSLPFKPTNDQISALKDIRDDFNSQIASRRVVMGDVGSGKTLVMLGAALMAYPNVSIIMAPTSILAEQIQTEALNLLPDFMKVMLVKAGDKDLNFSEYNLIIGTHALLYHQLPNASIIMIDEQHRFGSNQRSKINSLTRDAEFSSHFLQFSATPIPRTMTLIQSNIVKFSFLKQMPFKKDIQTIIITAKEFENLISHIKSEISQGRQVIVIYPLIEESDVSQYQSLEEGSRYWLESFENVYITHGKDSKKEEVLSEFRDNGDLLLTTTVVEVGISLPRLSIIVIVAPEMMGLATLHQLRGRVGRKGGKAWCYLFTKLKEPPKRLKEFIKTLDGFKVSEIDLKNRLSGDLLDGTVQHGSTFKFYEYEEEITEAARKRIS